MAALARDPALLEPYMFDQLVGRMLGSDTRMTGFVENQPSTSRKGPCYLLSRFWSQSAFSTAQPAQSLLK
jgi:hypothetical protein